MAKKKSKKPTSKKPMSASKKKPKKVAVTPHYDSTVVFEGIDGKFYSDQDCQNSTESIENHLLQGWTIDKEFENQTGYPGLRKQYVLKRRNTEGEEPIGYIGVF